MVKKTVDYKVTLTFNDVTLSKINELSKVLTPLCRPDQFEVQVTDPVEGIHNISTSTGIRPSGEKCETCYYIDCREGSIYKNK